MVNGLNEMIGARILVAVTYLNDDGEVDERFQFVGHVREVAPLVSIERPGSEPFTLPPAPEAYERSPSGQYTLRETGEVVDDVGYVTSWTVDRSEPPGTGVP
jgi:hypothetical protein